MEAVKVRRHALPWSHPPAPSRSSIVLARSKNDMLVYEVVQDVGRFCQGGEERRYLNVLVFRIELFAEMLILRSGQRREERDKGA